MEGNTIQTVNSSMYDTYMSTPGNTAKLGTAQSLELKLLIFVNQSLNITLIWIILIKHLLMY